MAPEAWRRVQSRLIDFTGADTNNKNPSRLMRLPGAPYFDKATRKPTGTAATMLHTGPQSYRLEEIEACIPAPEPELDLEDEARDLRELEEEQWADLPPRTLEEVNAAAEFIPVRVGGQKTYEQDRNALCGCSDALAQAGCADPDAAALALLGGKWPSRKDAEQCLATTTTRKAASFWAIAGQHGYDLRRRPAAAGAGGSRAKPDGDHQGRGGRTLVHWSDEAAFYPHAESIEAALSNSTRCHIDLSSVSGLGTVFERKRAAGVESVRRGKAEAASLDAAGAEEDAYRETLEYMYARCRQESVEMLAVQRAYEDSLAAHARELELKRSLLVRVAKSREAEVSALVRMQGNARKQMSVSMHGREWHGGVGGGRGVDDW
jgi:hypothetical protein